MNIQVNGKELTAGEVVDPIKHLGNKTVKLEPYLKILIRPLITNRELKMENALASVKKALEEFAGNYYGQYEEYNPDKFNIVFKGEKNSIAVKYGNLFTACMMFGYYKTPEQLEGLSSVTFDDGAVITQTREGLYKLTGIDAHLGLPSQFSR